MPLVRMSHVRNMAAALAGGAAGEVRTLARTRPQREVRQRSFRPRPRAGEPLYAPEVRSDHLPPMEYQDMPEPLPLRKVLGPSVILAGVGVGSGEYILWPYISANAGIGFLYLAVVGVTIQYFLNMEIERYTLATGETAIAGFARSWKPWGILFCFFAVDPEHLAGLGHGGRDDLQLPRRRLADDDRDDRAALDRGGVDDVARRLQGARARGVLQGRADDRLPDHRGRRRHRARPTGAT